MAGNHRVKRQRTEHFKGLPGRAQSVRVAKQFGENHPESVMPEGIAGNQKALLGVVEGQCIHVVTGHRHGLPGQIAEHELVACRIGGIVCEARRPLAERREQQRRFVPFRDGRGNPLWHGDMALKARLHGGIAADVI